MNYCKFNIGSVPVEKANKPKFTTTPKKKEVETEVTTKKKPRTKSEETAEQ